MVIEKTEQTHRITKFYSTTGTCGLVSCHYVDSNYCIWCTKHLSLHWQKAKNACKHFTNNKYNKYANYPDWYISPHVDHRRRPVCHTWPYKMYATKIVHLLDLWANTWAKIHQKGDDLLPTQIYHPAKFHHLASTHARDIRYKSICRQTHKRWTIYPQHAYRNVEIITDLLH